MSFAGMDMKKTKKRLIFFAAVIVFIFALWQAWGYTFVWENIQMDYLDFRPGPNTFSLASGDEYGRLNRGPFFSLTKGRYRLDLAADSDGENTIRIVTGNDARIEPAQATIPAHCWTMTYEFELLDDADNLEILIDFDSGSYLAIHELNLHMYCTDRVWMVLAAGLAAFALYVMWCKGSLTQERIRLLLIFAAAVFVAAWPALRENLYTGHDTVFHMGRVRNVIAGLRDGQIPVRIGGGGINGGYGSAVSVFYPDLMLYIPALLMISGTTVQFAFSAFFIIVNLASALSMYICARRIFDDEAAGVSASVFYVLAVYRLTDVYTRWAVGEMTAMAVIPLFVLGLWEVIWGNKDKWMLLALSATGIFQSHIISTVICAVMAAAACAMGAFRIIREKRWVPILKAVLIALLLNLFTLIPLLTYMAQGIQTDVLLMRCATKCNEVFELFTSDVSFARDIGLALLIGTAATLYALCGCRGIKEKRAWVCLALGALTALMTTEYFPWEWLEARTHGAVNYLQFPWRLMMLTDVFLALACGYGVLCLAKEKKELLSLGVLIVCMVGAFDQLSYLSVTGASQLDLWKTNEEGISSYYEYTIPGSNLEATLEQKEPELSLGVTMEQYRKTGTHITALVDAQTDAQVLFPVFGYDGYRATLDGNELDWARGDNNRIQVNLPAGAQGELEIRFAGRPIWRIADALSLCTLLTLIFAGAAGYAKRKRAAKGEK